MSNAINSGLRSLSGMGAWYDSIPFAPSDRESDPCAPSPAWCDYLGPAGYLIKECLPIDPLKCQTTTFGTSMTDANKQKAVAAGTSSVEAYCRANPEMCKVYSQYTGITGSPRDPGAPPDTTNYFLWFLGGTALLAVLMVKR